MKTNYELKKIAGIILMGFVLICSVISCKHANDLPGLDDDTVNKELEAARLQKKIDIYNKMLGCWKDDTELPCKVTDYFTYSDDLKAFEVLHIEPTKWYWTSEYSEEKTVVVKTFDKPFYNYIYLFDEWNDDSFFEKENVDTLMDLGWSSWKKESVVYINIKNLRGINRGFELFDTNDLPTTLNSNLRYIRVVTSNDDNNGDDYDPDGVNISLSGNWNYEVPGQTNAGGTVTFTNGTLKFKHKVGSLESTATYTVSGNKIEIEYMSFKERFTVTEVNSNTITLAYDGNEDYSQILGTFFQYMGSDKTITLTK